MSNTVFAVSSTAELYDALNSATGGDVIELASGQYDAIELRQYKNLNVTFDSVVTVRSADPDAPARITELEVTGASNLAFENLVFDYMFTEGDTWRTNPFLVSNSTGISFRDSLFDGDIGYGDLYGADGYPTAHGLTIRGSQQILVESSEFTGFARGIKTGDTQDLEILDNEFHGQRVDNIAIGADNQRLTIADNYMHDFIVAPNSGDHRDMIQFWNDGGSTATEDVLITRNVMVLGEEDHLTQSIFIGNGAILRHGDGENMFFRNFTITENVIVNGQKHGIHIDHVDGIEIANNTLLREDVQGGDPRANVPGISVQTLSTNVTIRDNVTSHIIGHNDQPDWDVAGNVLIQDHDRLAPNHYDDLFVNAVPGLRSDLANIQVLPDSVIAEIGAGATRLAYDATPDALTPLAHVVRDPEYWTDYVFDAGYSAGPDGPTGADALYHWDFGDGTQATGQVVTHSYSETGRYAVTLSVTTPDGETATTKTGATVGTPEILHLEPGNALLRMTTAEVIALPAGIADPDGDGPAAAREAAIFEGADTKIKVEGAALDGLRAAGDFSIEVSLSAENWAMDYGEVLRMQGGFWLRIDEDGRPVFSMSSAADDSYRLTSETTLNDGAWADIAIHFDGDAGALSMHVDGAEAAAMDVSGVLAADFKQVLWLGSVSVKTGFTGAMSDLTFSADTHAYSKLGAPQPVFVPLELDFQGFDLMDEYDAIETPVTLVGDARMRSETGTFVLDGDGDQIVVAHDATDSLGDQITVELDYCRDEADGAFARLAWFHGRLAIEAVDDGLRLMVRNSDGDREWFSVEDLGLNDTEWHSVRMTVDNSGDRISLAVDDEIVFVETGVDVAVNDSDLRKVWDWRLGGAWAGHLDGEIGNFRVSDQALPEPSAPEFDDAPLIPLPEDVFAF